MIVPILLSLGTFATLYATRDPVPTIVRGSRYLFGLPRALVFPGLTDAQIRSVVATTLQRTGGNSETFREVQLRSIDPTHVWMTGIWNGETGPSAEIREDDVRGPYALLFGSY